MSREITDEWLEVFDESIQQGEVLADSIFWRLALHTLPEGVNGADQRVIVALARIRQSVQETNRDALPGEKP